jgi:hypothetical protein
MMRVKKLFICEPKGLAKLRTFVPVKILLTLYLLNNTIIELTYISTLAFINVPLPSICVITAPKYI